MPTRANSLHFHSCYFSVSAMSWPYSAQFGRTATHIRPLQNALFSVRPRIFGRTATQIRPLRRTAAECDRHLHILLGHAPRYAVPAASRQTVRPSAAGHSLKTLSLAVTPHRHAPPRSSSTRLRAERRAQHPRAAALILHAPPRALKRTCGQLHRPGRIRRE